MAYRVDSSTASTSLPTPAAVGPNPNGYFTEGNVSTNTPSTIVDNDWLNSMQEEICRFITAQGITLSKTSYNQLQLAVAYMQQNNPNTFAASTSSANTYAATLATPPIEYEQGMGVLILFTHSNTSVSTLNLNSLGAVTIKRNDGTNLQAGDIQPGMMCLLIYDGTYFQLMNRYQVEVGNYGASTSSANTYTASISNISALSAGSEFNILFTNGNTGAATLNINSLGATSIVRPDGTALQSGDIKSGMMAYLVYNGTDYQLMNFNNPNGTYAASTSSANTYTATISPFSASLTAGTHLNILFTNANTGAATLNVNGLGAINIKLTNGNALSAGNITANMMAYLAFDGTNFQLLNPAGIVTINEFFIISSQTYYPSPGLIEARVRAVAGGGGGAGCGSSNTTVGAGTPGGAGGYAEGLFSASQIGSSVSVTIGAAGVGGAALSNGTSGGQTLFGSLLTCNGGVHGVAQNSSSGTAGGNGGAGGTATGGTINITGQSGGFAAADNNSINLGWVTSGGNSMMGLGGQGGFATSGGTIGGFNATGYGAGGGGSVSVNTGSSSSYGGNASPGALHIIEFCANY